MRVETPPPAVHLEDEGAKVPSHSGIATREKAFYRRALGKRHPMERLTAREGAPE